MMQIAIDASRTTVAKVTGTERYALELIRGIIQLNTEHNITLYFRDTPPPNLFPPSERVTYRVIPFRRAWTHMRFAAAIWQDRPDVTFVPAHTLPFLFPGKAIVTVHDLGYKFFPQAHPFKQRVYLDMTTRYSARRATLIFADSQATANDLTRLYGISADKIRVVYPGVTPPEINVVDVVKKYSLPERYFLFIGTLQPRKNIKRIVQAYAQYRANTSTPVGLVLAGGKGWLYDPTWVEGVPGVHLTGYIDEADKGALYQGAIGLVFPTLYEGFGFPVVEAMHCGTPVLASNTSSLPELVGDAGLLVDPHNISEIAAGMAQLESMPHIKPTHQLTKFTWEQAAQQALEGFEHV
ncbi:MAG: glycosyltransferase family 1 protein [Phototrophicales bacterium]